MRSEAKRAAYGPDRGLTGVQIRTPSARLVARQASELLLGRGRRWRVFGTEELLPSLMFEVVLSASIAHHPYREAGGGPWLDIAAAAASGRPVTGTAVAQSMGVPHTTIRRHAAELVQGGVLERSPAGFRVATGVLNDGRFACVVGEDVADLEEALGALAEAGYEPAARAVEAEIRALPPDVIERMLLAFALRATENFTALYKDFTGGTISAAIIAANVQQITRDAELARRYAAEDTPPPDALRQPVAVRQLARLAGFPFETVRRRVNALIDEGMATWKDGGVIVPAHVLLGDRYIDHNRRIQSYFEQMLNTLVSLAA